jgi:hypothetical protein
LTIDYERAAKQFPVLKRKLTQAQRSLNPIRVLATVEAAFDEFDQWGAWPDDWALWQAAARDAWFDYNRDPEPHHSYLFPQHLLVDRFERVLTR